MRALRSLGQLSHPGQQLEGPLHVRGRYRAGVLCGGFFQGSLGQVVEESRQAVAGLQE